MYLSGDTIFLRPLEPEDLDYVYTVENDPHLWEVSHTQTPYSRYLIKQYLENAHQDIYEARQLRLVIVDKTSLQNVGLIDLFEFDPKNERVGLGIVISDAENRNYGYGSEAVSLLISYVFDVLHCYQVFVNIDVTNAASIKLFSKFGFQCAGIKKEWNRNGSIRKDEAMYQLINNR